MRHTSPDENDRGGEVVVRPTKIILAIALLSPGLFFFAAAQDSRESVNKETSKPEVRGGIVYKAYCVVCHGERGEGADHAAKRFPGRDLTIKLRPHEYYEKIIRHGGHGVGASSLMPAWQNDLSEEQIGDVVAYITILGDAVRRGEVVYKTNCILCHGIHADGNGRASALFHPAPVNLTRSTVGDIYKLQIIRRGSQAMGRSQGMPPWGGRLTEAELHDLIEYLRTISLTPTAEKTAP